jgi:predicted O-methyltransferase YrrM
MKFSTVDIPHALIHDDNSADEACVPTGHPLPVSSSPCYTIYRLLKHLRPNSVLEIGTQAGTTACAMALAFRANGLKPEITCVDPFCATTDNAGLTTLQQWYDTLYGTGTQAGVTLIMAKSADILPLLNQRFDFVFVDGSHQYEDVLEDCKLALDHLRPGGYFLVHDYVIYDSVRRACDEVIAAGTLPHAVNEIQRNHRGELCGWVIARKPSGAVSDEVWAIRHHLDRLCRRVRVGIGWRFRRLRQTLVPG